MVWKKINGDGETHVVVQEEKAEGLIKIGSYSIESAGEHKRKLWVS